jgi:N-methylhydantoinase B
VPMEYSLFAERRRFAPRGADGGEPGSPGGDTINGDPIPGKSIGSLAAGDHLRMSTPGGGAHGPPT